MQRLLRAAARLNPDPVFYKTVLRYALNLNGWREEREASARLLAAWCDLVILAVTEHMASLKLVFDAPGLAARELVDLLVRSSRLLAEEASKTRLRPDERPDERSEVLLRVCLTLLKQLHLEASNVHVDPAFTGAFAAALAPSVCHGILRDLLSSLLRSEQRATTRRHVYGALLAYLRLCRLPAWGHAPVVLRVQRPSAMANFCAAGSTARLELDAGNLEELRRQGKLLVSLLAHEGTSGSEQDQGRSQALALLQAVLGLTEGAGTLVEPWLFHSGLPAAVAAMLGTPKSLLLLPAPALLCALDTAEAQLSFLLSVACNTPGGAAHLVGCGVITQLSGCQLIDALLEQRGEQRVAARDKIFLPALRLVCALLERLPDSRELDPQAVAFVDAHHSVLLRALALRAAVSDVGELRETHMAARLLCRLCARDTSGEQLARFRGALEQLCWRFFARLPPAHHQGQTSGHAESHVWLVQSTLAGYLRKLVADKRIALPTTAAVSSCNGPPTLPLVAQLVKQCSRAFRDVLSERHALLSSLKDSLRAHDGVERAGESSRASVAAELVSADADARVLLCALENALQAIHDSLAGVVLKQSEAESLATLRPVFDELSPVQDDECDKDLAFLKLLLRRLREAVEA
jgi:hypothetical protein